MLQSGRRSREADGVSQHRPAPLPRLVLATYSSTSAMFTFAIAQTNIVHLCCRAAGGLGSATARNSTEQHPFHMHGHHFWVLATGNGTYNSSAAVQYNLVNPIYRDTHSVLKGGWSAIRFVVSLATFACSARHQCLQCVSHHAGMCAHANVAHVLSSWRISAPLHLAQFTECVREDAVGQLEFQQCSGSPLLLL